MKNAALAIMSVVLAAIAYSVILAGMAFIAFIPIMLDIYSLDRDLIMIFPLYFSAFLTGLFLTRVKPFFMPIATVPLGTMAIWSLWGLSYFLDCAKQGTTPGLGTSIGFLGIVASMGLVSLLGCIVATKASNRLANFSLPFYQLACSLVVLICTSSIAFILRMALAGNQFVTDFVLRRTLIACLIMLLVIAAFTIANMFISVVQAYQKAKV